MIYVYIHTYIHTYIYIYSKEMRQRSVVATLSFTPVGDLQATDRSNLLSGVKLRVNLTCQLPEDRQQA